MIREARYKVLPYDLGRYQYDGEEEFTQWWYFDAEFESGHRVMAAFFPRMLGNVDDHDAGPVPGVTLVVMDPEGNNHHSHEYFPGRFSGDPERMRGTFGDNLVEWADGRYRLRVYLGETGIELDYQPLLPPWPPLPGRRGFLAPPLMWLLAPGKYFHYASFVPRAKVEGKLFLPGGEVEVEGTGYHEQGRTNAPLAGIFKHWYWIRLFLDDWTIIFPLTQAPGAFHTRGMRALLVYRGDECLADLIDGTRLLLDHKILEYQSYEPAGRDDVPRRGLFTARTPGLRLRVEMDLKHQLEAFCWTPFTVKPERQPAWMQHVMDVGVDIRRKGKTVHLEGEGIFETMLV
jgi:hypothetical protein